MIMQHSNPSTSGVEAGYKEFIISLGFMKLCPNTQHTHTLSLS